MNALRSTTLAAIIVAALAVLFSLVGPLLQTGFGYALGYISALVGGPAILTAVALAATVFTRWARA